MFRFLIYSTSFAIGLLCIVEKNIESTLIYIVVCLAWTAVTIVAICWNESNIDGADRRRHSWKT